MAEEGKSCKYAVVAVNFGDILCVKDVRDVLRKADWDKTRTAKRRTE